MPDREKLEAEDEDAWVYTEERIAPVCPICDKPLGRDQALQDYREKLLGEVEEAVLALPNHGRAHDGPTGGSIATVDLIEVVNVLAALASVEEAAETRAYDPRLECCCGHTARWHGQESGAPEGSGECEFNGFCSCKRFLLRAMPVDKDAYGTDEEAEEVCSRCGGTKTVPRGVGVLKMWCPGCTGKNPEQGKEEAAE